MQIQNSLVSASENANPMNVTKHTTILSATQLEEPVDVEDVIMHSAWTEKQDTEPDVARNSCTIDSLVTGRVQGPVHTQVASCASGNPVASYHSISPLETPSFADTAHQQSVFDRASVHHRATDTEASVLAPQMVG